MSTESSDEAIEMACLGRTFRLGMLYDARSDKLITGVTLWGDNKLKSALDSSSHIGSDFEVVTEDSLESKASHLDISGSLKLSFMGGLVDVSGSAKYLKDRKSSKQQSRVSLKYWSTTKFEQLTMDQLATEHIEYPEVFSNKMATHVVTGILYGADAVFVFDRKVDESEDTNEIHGKLEVLIKALPGIKDLEIKGKAELNMKDEDKEEASKLTCKFHGDLKLPRNPTTFEDAVKIYKQLPDLLDGKNGPIEKSKKVWLYPLSKLNSDAAKLVHKISVGFVHQAQAIKEELLDLEVQSNDLIKTRACSHFSGIQTQLTKFKKMVSEYGETTFSKELKRILPTIREGQPETKLADLFKSKDRSPFKSFNLTKWMNNKEEEIKVLGAYLDSMQDIQFAPSHGDLIANTVKHDLVLCLSFQVASSSDDYLDKMQAYLYAQDPAQTSSDKVSPSWLEDSEVMETMRQKTKLFTAFAEANKDNAEVKYVVADSRGERTGSSCAIWLYDDGKRREYEPPSAPFNVQTSPGGVTHSSIRLDWSKPEYGSENVKFYTVSYHQDDPSDSWDSVKTKGKETSITVDNLQENHGYYFKVRAECKIGVSKFSGESDLIVTASKTGHALSWETIKEEIYKEGFPWDTLARHLEMPQYKIELISKEKPWETLVNLEQVIQWWLHQDDASWSQLADTLQEKMGLRKLARKIRQNNPE